jgi:hypothetical protein
VRLFQNSRYYPSLGPRLRELTRNCPTFAAKIDRFLAFRENALLPVDQRAEWAFFTIGDDEDVQRTWARENGLTARVSLADILRAQIEHHRSDVFYDVDATGWPGDFVRTLLRLASECTLWPIFCRRFYREHAGKSKPSQRIDAAIPR